MLSSSMWQLKTVVICEDCEEPDGCDVRCISAITTLASVSSQHQSTSSTSLEFFVRIK